MTILYHFTAERFLQPIFNQGLTLGILTQVSDEGKLFFLKNHQWLTVNPRFKQSWYDPETARTEYSRVETRLTIRIPDNKKQNIINWFEYSKDHPNDLNQWLNACGVPENWRIYKGIALPEWIRHIKFNPEYLKLITPKLSVKN